MPYLSPLPNKCALNSIIGESRVYDGYQVQNVVGRPGDAGTSTGNEGAAQPQQQLELELDHHFW